MLNRATKKESLGKWNNVIIFLLTIFYHYRKYLRNSIPSWYSITIFCWTVSIIIRQCLVNLLKWTNNYSIGGSICIKMFGKFRSNDINICHAARYRQNIDADGKEIGVLTEFYQHRTIRDVMVIIWNKNATTG